MITSDREDHGRAGSRSGVPRDPGRDTPPTTRDRHPRDPDAGASERRVLLALLAGGFLVVGAWALLFPASFHGDFPLGRAWVALDGPYNEHLVRDVGALQLALAVVVGAAIWRPRLTRVAAVATLVFAVPHLLYHATHSEPFGVGDAVAQLVALAIQVVVPVWLLTAGSRARRRAAMT